MLRRAAIGAVLGMSVLGAADARADRISAVATLSATDVRVPGEEGLEPFGRGVGATISFLHARPCCFLGYELDTRFVMGENDQRLYDLGVSLLAGPRVVDRPIAPFLALGLDVAAVQAPDPAGDDRGVLVGVHGSVGFHGLVDKIYWRVSGGYLGAVGGLYAQAGLGFAFGDL